MSSEKLVQAGLNIANDITRKIGTPIDRKKKTSISNNELEHYAMIIRDLANSLMEKAA